MTKPRILLVNEFSRLSTGYSVYGYEVMSRLHATGKYELAELACYVPEGDPRLGEVPWKVFPNLPSDPNAYPAYNSKATNQFGEWRFEEVCLQFKPDIVWDIRDVFMFEFEERSPFRRFFKHAIMPTVDAMPQAEQWLATMQSADAVLCYSDFGVQVLEQEGGGCIKLMGTASPGVDLNLFAPMDKNTLRDMWGFDKDIKVVGTTCRNQVRKRFPELVQSFSHFLKTAPSELAKKTYLYLHTSYPDQGWDIPRLIKQYGLGSKCLVTYKCRACNYVFASFFQDARAICRRCHQTQAGLPNTQLGVSREELAQIYNLFDIYVQYANSEGFGIPMVEAAACGLPVLAPDYSAMADVVRKVQGIPIKVLTYIQDVDLGCMRAIPDNGDLVQKLIKLLGESPSLYRDRCFKARKAVEKEYTWDRATAAWVRVFDHLLTLPAPLSWDSPPNTFQPVRDIPGYFPDGQDFVNWCIDNILGEPEKKNGYLALRLLRDLQWGATTGDMARNYHNESSLLGAKSPIREFTTDHVINELAAMCENRNQWERRRCHLA